MVGTLELHGLNPDLRGGDPAGKLTTELQVRLPDRPQAGQRVYAQRQHLFLAGLGITIAPQFEPLGVTSIMRPWPSATRHSFSRGFRARIAVSVSFTEQFLAVPRLRRQWTSRGDRACEIGSTNQTNAQPIRAEVWSESLPGDLPG